MSRKSERDQGADAEDRHGNRQTDQQVEDHVPEDDVLSEREGHGRDQRKPAGVPYRTGPARAGRPPACPPSGAKSKWTR